MHKQDSANRSTSHGEIPVLRDQCCSGTIHRSITDAHHVHLHTPTTIYTGYHKQRLSSPRLPTLRSHPQGHSLKNHSAFSHPRPILLSIQASPITAVNFRNSLQVDFLTRPTQLLNRNVAPPDSIAVLKRWPAAISVPAALEMENVDIPWPVAVAHGIPVRADLLEGEADCRALLGENDGVGDGLDGHFCDAFFCNVAAVATGKSALLAKILVAGVPGKLTSWLPSLTCYHERTLRS